MAECIYSPNSDDYDAVGGKIEVYVKQLDEIEFKCYPEVVIDPEKANSGINTEENGMSIKSVVENILNGYVDAKKETFAGHHIRIKKKPEQLLLKCVRK